MAQPHFIKAMLFWYKEVCPAKLYAEWGINMYYVYILKLVNKKHYVGFSSNLRKRIKAHKLGNVQQTRKFQPIRLIFYAAFESKTRAVQFEKYLKSSSGFAFRNKRLI